MISRLTQADRDVIERCGLSSLLDMPQYIINWGLLIALVERWHNDMNTFHLATSEIIVDRKDYYQILWIPVIGALFPYEKTREDGIEILRWIFHDDQIYGYEIPW